MGENFSAGGQTNRETDRRNALQKQVPNLQKACEDLEFLTDRGADNNLLSVSLNADLWLTESPCYRKDTEFEFKAEVQPYRNSLRYFLVTFHIMSLQLPS